MIKLAAPRAHSSTEQKVKNTVSITFFRTLEIRSLPPIKHVESRKRKLH
jgi:hypothetical protein